MHSNRFAWFWLVGKLVLLFFTSLKVLVLSAETLFWETGECYFILIEYLRVSFDFTLQTQPFPHSDLFKAVDYVCFLCWICDVIESRRARRPHHMCRLKLGVILACWSFKWKREGSIETPWSAARERRENGFLIGLGFSSSALFRHRERERKYPQPLIDCV